MSLIRLTLEQFGYAKTKPKPVLHRFPEMAAEIFDRPVFLTIHHNCDNGTVKIKMGGRRLGRGYELEQKFSKLLLLSTDPSVYDSVRRDYSRILEIYQEQNIQQYLKEVE